MQPHQDRQAERLYAEYLGLDDLSIEAFCSLYPEQAEGIRSLHRAASELQLEFEGGHSVLDPQPPSNRLIVRERVGEGGMGIVYRVHDENFGRDLAMKVLRGPAGSRPQEEVERFLREGSLTAQLDHPGIVPVHSRGVDKAGRLYFTMKLVEGIELEELLRDAKLRGQGRHLDQVAEVLIRVCDAISYAHSRDVLHRDLKPTNIMVGPFGEVYVMDWGLARSSYAPERSAAEGRRAGREERPAVETAGGEVLGTPAFMAPEQARGDQEQVGPRSDVYSLGAILHYAIQGTPPYCEGPTAPSGEAVMARLLKGPPPPPRGPAPPELVAIASKAMAQRLADRYPDMGELCRDLAAFRSGRPVQALRLGPLRRVTRWIARNPVAASVIAGMTLSGGFAMARLAELGRDLAQQTALEAAANQAAILEEVNALYSEEVVSRIGLTDVHVTHDYESRPNSIPLPATFLTRLGERLSASVEGLEVRHYSDSPFSFRADEGLDTFQSQALQMLRARPDEPFIRVKGGDAAVLQYATARRMESSCVACHNAHPDSPRRDWSVGDVRGVLEIRQAMQSGDELRRYGLRSVLMASGLVLLFSIAAVSAAFARR